MTTASLTILHLQQQQKSPLVLIRLSGAGAGDEGEAAALKASAKEAGSLEDKQLAEALARFPISKIPIFTSTAPLSISISGLLQTIVWTPVNRSRGAQALPRLQPLPKQPLLTPSRSPTLPTLCRWASPERCSF